MEIKHKIWLEENGKVLFGQGREELLRAIDELHCLSAAAKKLSMSYRAAWGRLKASEKRLGVKLVEMQTHGEGSSLTAAAKDLLHKFDQLEKEPCTFLEERGRKLLLIRPDEASGQTNEKIIRKLCGWINAAFIYTQSLHLLSHAIEYI
jgi:molybdate transport system regulatory protein